MQEIARHDFTLRAHRLDGDRRGIDDQLQYESGLPFQLPWLGSFHNP